MLLSKHHGLGNDFLVALDERNGRALTVDGDLARELCDRRRGIGADGLIHGVEPTAEQASHGIDVVMRLYNADGGRAEMSGNGIRCLGQAVADHRGIERGVVEVLTDAGRRPLSVEPTGEPGTRSLTVGMGVCRPGPHVPEGLDELLPARHGTVEVGNPHLVVLVGDPDVVDLATEGAWLEQQFPHGINVEYVSVEPAGTGVSARAAVGAERSALRLRVWERGVGITEACGTGACAAAFQARAWGLVGDEVQVSMPGGAATVRLDGAGTATLVGPSVFIADIEFEAAPERAPVEA